MMWEQETKEEEQECKRREQEKEPVTCDAPSRPPPSFSSSHHICDIIYDVGAA